MEITLRITGVTNVETTQGGDIVIHQNEKVTRLEGVRSVSIEIPQDPMEVVRALNKARDEAFEFDRMKERVESSLRRVRQPGRLI